MQKKKRSDIAGRAWAILRLALLWARKGGVFKRKLMMDLPKLLKSLCGGGGGSSADQQRRAIHYGERELSFDNTPVIHVKMHRPSSMRFRMPHIPCINPRVDFDYDFNDDTTADAISYCNDVVSYRERQSFLMGGEEDGGDGGCDEAYDEESDQEAAAVDHKAEQFIANFYRQMKLQRQISYLQYNHNEMINRGTSGSSKPFDQ